MKAIEILNHFKINGSWVNWEKSVDQILFGDQHMEVKGITVSWMPTLSNLKEALKNEFNIFIAHEPLFAAKIDEKGNIIDSPIIKDPHARWVIGKRTITPNDIWLKKMEWYKQVV
jgi:hypothetical protein